MSEKNCGYAEVDSVRVAPGSHKVWLIDPKLLHSTDDGDWAAAAQRVALRVVGPGPHDIVGVINCGGALQQRLKVRSSSGIELVVPISRFTLSPAYFTGEEFAP